jgi:glyoxylase-like metal-dependent hydrolase (beta-lactamase superfamily II)
MKKQPISDVIASEPFEIAKNIYWVGKKTGNDLEMNVFLRIFKKGNQKINMLIDPGPPSDFDIIEQNVKKVLGDDYKIHFAFINHQDPDVGYNAIYFQRYFPNMQIITMEDTWRLIKFYGFNPKRYIPIDRFKSRTIKMITGHKLVFAPTPYCHFRGACALYDVTERILFTGDLFGGLSDSPGFYADEQSWSGIKIFQQIYMPTNIAVENALGSIKRVDPSPALIAPQHGKIIKDEFVNHFIEKLKTLAVGLDLASQNKILVSQYIKAFNAIIQQIKLKIDKDIYDSIFSALFTDESFPEIFSIKDEKIYEVKIAVEDAMQFFLNNTLKNQADQIKRDLQFLVLHILTDMNLPTENLNLDVDDSATNSSEDNFISEEINEPPEGTSSEATNISHLNIRNLLQLIEDESGSDKFNELTVLRIMLKIPPDVLKRNKVNSYDDFFQLEETDDIDFIKYIIKGSEQILGHRLPESVLN